jgi:mannosyl-3-phosphoglycerate phosphatase
MKNPVELLVFSDLDGTLLDHDTYRWDAAQPALERLHAWDIPVVLASSKTAAEITLLQREMGLKGNPAIVENGSGVIGLPNGTRAETYQALRRSLDTMPPEYRDPYQGFGDMTVEDVAAVTGLTPDAAQRAKQRKFSEPGIWSGSDADLQAFQAALAEHSIIAQQGGRFLTLSFGKTKANAMDEVIDVYRPDLTLALGDAPNDRKMLEKADHGVIVANPHRAPMPKLDGEDSGRITRTDQPGPEGWNAAVNAFLDSPAFNTGRHAHG